MKTWKMVLLFVALTAMIISANATNVSGPVSGTWTLSGSPYNVIGEINVPANQTLVIQAGVNVIFQGHYAFIVNTNATLQALGTQQDSILFTAADTATGWWGLRLMSASDSCRLEYCEFTYGRKTATSGLDGLGGALLCESTNALIKNSTFTGNSSNYSGGAICIHQSSNAMIENCKITNNISNIAGGGIDLSYPAHLKINNCLIAQNLTGGRGGGMVASGYSTIINCTITNNTAQSFAGGIDFDQPDSLQNSIMYFNAAPSDSQFNGSPIISYSDIQGTLWPGIGNINADPLFVDGYHLQQPPCQPLPQSPCVNAGDPASTIIIGTTRTDNVQDAGIVDMGYHYSLPLGPATPSNLAWNNPLIFPYYIGLNWVDNSNNEDNFILQRSYNNSAYSNVAIIPPNQTTYTNTNLSTGTYQYRLWAANQYGNSDTIYTGMIYIILDINITPINPPIIIYANGGDFQYNINVHNLTTSSQTFQVWNKVRQPSGQYYPPNNPIWGPITRTLPGNANPTRTLTQTIPSGVEAGLNYFISYIGTYPNVIMDSSYFTFTKLAAQDGGPWISESKCEGDMFDEYAVDATVPETPALMKAYPNPFNPTTTINYTLPAAARVKLSVYDIGGRLLATLVDGYRDAGAQQVYFDAAELPSGVYLAQLEFGSCSQVQKLVLLK